MFQEGSENVFTKNIAKQTVSNSSGVMQVQGDVIGSTTGGKAENSLQDKEKAHMEIAEWISLQSDGLNYWEIIKGEIAIKFPEFREWLKNKDNEKDV